MENRFKIYLNNPTNDLPEVRAMIAKHLNIPEDPPESIQLFQDNRAVEHYTDPFDEDEEEFESFQKEYEHRAENLDIYRTWINEMKEENNREKHFQKLEEIQNRPGITCAQRTELQRQEWETFTHKSQVLFNYMQILKFEEKILMKKLAEYRREIYAV